MQTLARSLAEVAASFDAACDASGITEMGIAAIAGCAQSTISRIRNGKAEPGVVLFTRVILHLGKTPDQMLLTNPGETRVQSPDFDEDEHFDLARMIEIFKALKQRTLSPISPVKMFTEALAAVEASTRDATALPVGSSVKKEGDATVYTLPPSDPALRIAPGEEVPASKRGRKSFEEAD